MQLPRRYANFPPRASRPAVCHVPYVSPPYRAPSRDRSPPPPLPRISHPLAPSRSARPITPLRYSTNPLLALLVTSLPAASSRLFTTVKIFPSPTRFHLAIATLAGAQGNPVKTESRAYRQPAPPVYDRPLQPPPMPSLHPSRPLPPSPLITAIDAMHAESLAHPPPSPRHSDHAPLLRPCTSSLVLVIPAGLL